MSRTRSAIVAAGAAAAVCVGWALLAWQTGFGGEAFMLPGRIIADVVLPIGPGEPFEVKSAKSVAEGFVQLAVVRGLERGLQVWWCAVAFWLLLVPALIFVAILRIRRYGA